jgi:hypothetical protein
VKTYALMLLALLFALPHLAEARSRYYNESYYDSYYDGGFGGYYDDGYFYDDYAPRRRVRHTRHVAKKKVKRKVVKAKAKRATIVRHTVKKPVIKTVQAPVIKEVVNPTVKEVVKTNVETPVVKQTITKADDSVPAMENPIAERGRGNHIMYKDLKVAHNGSFKGTGSRSFGVWGKPTSKIMRGQCNIKVDCPHEKIYVNGESKGSIVCANTTGNNSRWVNANHIGTIDRAVTPSAGNMFRGSGGFPMLGTTPAICGNCFFHQYPYVASHKSLGCVGVEPIAWEALSKCGGSKFVMIPKSMSNQKADQIVTAYEDKYFPAEEQPTATAKIPAILSGSAR